MQENAAVAAAHHQEGDHIQCDEMEHVVDGFLPAAAEASMSRTLSEVHILHPDGLEDEQLEKTETVT